MRGDGERDRRAAPGRRRARGRRARRSQRTDATPRRRGGTRGRRDARGARPRGGHRALRRAARIGASRSPWRSPPRRGDARPLVADLNAISPATVRARRRGARRAWARDVVDGSISGPPPHAAGTTRIYLSGERAAEIAALPLRGRRARRRRRRGRARVRREDVHRLGLQGARRAAHAGAPHRAPLRRRRARPRRPRGDRARGPGATGATVGEGVGEGMAIRRRDGGDRRDTGRRRPHAGALPGDLAASTPSWPAPLADAPEEVSDDVPSRGRARRLSAGAAGPDGAEARRRAA